MLKKWFKTLFGKKASNEDTRKVEDYCNYWADEDGVDYSPSFTAQDALSSAVTETVNSSDTKSKEEEENKKTTFGGGCGCSGGCGGGCIGGCGGGCL